jgi:hypothetical protein
MAGRIVITAIKKKFLTQDISSSQDWFLDCLTTLFHLQVSYSIESDGDIETDCELIKIWAEATAACFKLLPRLDILAYFSYVGKK